MTQLPQNSNGTIVKYHDIRFPEGFEVSWAGKFSPPTDPPGLCLCFGSANGNLLFTDEFGQQQIGPRKGSPSGEAINGVAQAGDWLAVSTRQEVHFWPTNGGAGGGSLPHGAHGITATPSGSFIAPLGRLGVLAVQPPLGNGEPLMVHQPDNESLYVYRVAILRSRAGGEVLACAARQGGIIAGEFTSSQETHAMSTAPFKDLDIVDICPLCPETDSLAAVALGRDGSLVLFRDVLTDPMPMPVKFDSVKGVAYRVVCCRGDIYILTSKGLYVLANFGSRFVNGEPTDGFSPPVLPLPMEAIDMNLVDGRWLLVILSNLVRKFDVDFIHEQFTGLIKHEEIQAFLPTVLSLEPGWMRRDIKQTSQSFALAG
jgi:hypothetical protein